MALTSSYDVKVNYLMQVDLGQNKKAMFRRIGALYTGLARRRKEGLANLLHTAFTSSLECLAQHISQAESARWNSPSSIPVHIPKPA